MDHQTIKDSLARLYRGAYDVWYGLMELSKEAVRDGDNIAYSVFNSRAKRESKYLDGIRDAARELGITTDEFMDAVRKDDAE